MIIKSMSHKRPVFDYIIPYIFGKETENEQGQSVKIKQLLRGYDEENWVRQFHAGEQQRQSKYGNKSVKLYHEVISLHYLDREQVTASMLKDIGKRYLSKRAPQARAIGGAHFANSPHLHLCIAGIDIYGKSIRLSKRRFEEIKLELEREVLQQYPQLQHSRCEHGKGERSNDKQYQRNKRMQQEKERVISTIKPLFEQSNSRDDFARLLKQNKITPHYRNGKLTGVKEKNTYRFSSLGLDVSLLDIEQEVQDKMKQIQQARKQNKDRVRER